MKNFSIYRRCLAGVALFVVVASFAGCSGDDNQEPIVEPDGKLRLEVSSDYAKVGEMVSFTVFKGDVDVTSQAEIRLKGDKTPYSKNYKATKAGTFKFAAIYDGSSTSYTPVKFYVPFRDEGEFFKKALVLKFTGTWCAACPLMYKYMSKIEKERPGRMAVIAVHSGDVFAFDECDKLVQDFDVSSFPRAVFDYKSIISNNASELNEALDNILAEEPAVCGIALDATVTGEEASVKATIRIAEKGRYRICCAVVEDGLRHEGGSSDDGLGNYYHVLRRFLTERFGDDAGTREAGEEFEREFKFSVSEEWKKENCEVIVYAMRVQEDGTTLYANNAATCPLDGGSSRFEYETAPDFGTGKATL